jgi:hypothetical protein
MGFSFSVGFKMKTSVILHFGWIIGFWATVFTVLSVISPVIAGE